MNNPEINYFVNVIRRRWLVLVIVMVISLAAIPVVLASLPGHKSTAELLIVSQTSKDTTLTEPDLPSIVTSTEVLNRVIRRLKLNTNPTALAKLIKTKLPAKSSTLALSFTDRDAERAALIANAIADESCIYFHEVVTRGYTYAVSALNARIAESRSKIAVADARLQRASAKNVFASSDKALDDLTTQVEALQAQHGQLISTLAADQATAEALDKQLLKINPIVRGEILQKDISYQLFQAGLAKDEADLNSERASFHKSFPGLRALAQRVARERLQLKVIGAAAVQNGAGLSASSTQTILDEERAAGTIAADRERLRATDAQVISEQKHLQEIAGAGAAVSTLRAQRNAALQQYLTLAQRLGTTQGDAAQAASMGTLVVISSAVPGPSESSKLAPTFAALIIAIAIAAAYAADALDRRFWSVREIENVYRRAVLFEVGRPR